MSEQAAATDEKQAVPNQVFVGGMTPETTIDQLTKHFASLQLKPVGPPTLFLNPEGVSKGCALIPFGSPEEVKAAVAALENTELEGQKLRAREDRGPKRPRRREQVNQDNSYVYVGNLDPAVTQEELETLFAPYGKIQYVNISRKRRSENSLGWATVQLASEEEAQKALQGLNGSSFKDKNLTVEPLRSLPRKARARKEREPRDPNIPALENAEPDAVIDPTIVWVGNLAWTTTEEALSKLFAQHGEVKDVVVTRQKRSNQSRGWGTVTFATAEQATAAVNALNGTSLEERDIEVQIRRGPRRRRRAPREPRETNDNNDTAAAGDRPRRARRRRQPRAQNSEGEGEQQARPNQRPRRQESKQTDQTAEEGKTRRRPRARRPRNDSAQGNENTTASSDQNNDAESKGPRRRRRRQRKGEDGNEGEGTEDQERRPRAERKEPERVTVDHPDRHVYVRNLAWEVTDDDLKEYFSQCGNVSNAKVTLNPKGASRGWGTVEMASAAEAQKALSLDKQKFKERQLIVRLDKRVIGRE